MKLLYEVGDMVRLVKVSEMPETYFLGDDDCYNPQYRARMQADENARTRFRVGFVHDQDNIHLAAEDPSGVWHEMFCVSGAYLAPHGTLVGLIDGTLVQE